MSLWTLCLYSFAHSACWPFSLSLSICVRERVSCSMRGCICHCLSQGNPVVPFCHQGNQADHLDHCGSPSSMSISLRCVILDHSLECILTFTVKIDSVEVICLHYQGKSENSVVLHTKCQKL